MMGIPVEPFGFSNDAAGHFGPPAFADARLHLAAAGSHILVNLR
jgi:uncharacterized protein (DUF2141 family)